MFSFKDFGGFMLSTLVTGAGSYFAHAHPEWAAWIVPLIGFLTHHSGKAAGEKGGNGAAP